IGPHTTDGLRVGIDRIRHALEVFQHIAEDSVADLPGIARRTDHRHAAGRKNAGQVARGRSNPRRSRPGIHTNAHFGLAGGPSYTSLPSLPGPPEIKSPRAGGPARGDRRSRVRATSLASSPA